MDVLDLARGHGRISNRLAARGCRVTGLDVTPLFLERAGASCARCTARWVLLNFRPGGPVERGDDLALDVRTFDARTSRSLTTRVVVWGGTS